MRFPTSFLDEIKVRLPVSAVARKRVKLAKSGREWKGLSPFNPEKTASFFVNDQKMAWFDFSSGRNGNIFDFVMATEGLTFPEAVERLAAEAGLPLPKVSQESEQQERRRAGLQEVLELAARFYETQLQQQAAARARAYLCNRGVSAALQAQFRLGFAPNERFALRDHLAPRGAGVEVMIEAGLLIHGEGINVPYDRFRDRVIFPIADRAGRIIAFGGRALDKEAQPKYLNSPETALFHKGSILYNSHNARASAHEKGTVIAVEGYVDVISMTAAGFPNCVAPLGTALTPAQCELLWRMAPEPILCFDGDKAGRKAAFRAVDTILPLIGPARTMRFALLPDDQDPDDLARSGGGSAVVEVISSARPLIELLWRREIEAGPLDTPERRALLEARLVEAIRGIRDETLRRHYRAEIDGRLTRLMNSFTGQISGSRPERSFAPRAGSGGRSWRGALSSSKLGYISSPVAPSLALSRARAGRATLPRREVLIIELMFSHPQLLSRYAEELASLDFVNPEMDRLRDLLLTKAGDVGDDCEALRSQIDAAGFAALRHKLDAAAAILPLWCLQPDAALSDAEEVMRQALALHRKSRALHTELKLAEIALGNDPSEINLDRLRDIQAELVALEGMEASIDGFGSQSGRQIRAV